MKRTPVVAIRVDASLMMGTGHVMRCLALAEALREKGGTCHFISRTHPGNLLDLIRQMGFIATELPIAPDDFYPQENGGGPQLAHADWLGCDWQVDGAQTKAALRSIEPDWLVVDHYALDHQWEAALQDGCNQLLVIDDLADRSHHCDLLLDQNLGRGMVDYAGLVPAHCEVLAGPQYALLRPEFSAHRAYSMRRRERPVLKKLLITMGGVDQFNVTGRVLQALARCRPPQDFDISVIMGLHAPWLQDVKALAAQMPWPTEVVLNAGNMAQRMSDSDLAIGAAGSTSWERCCLGLPTLMVVLAENQRDIAINLEKVGAAIVLDQGDEAQFAAVLEHALVRLAESDLALANLCHAASLVTDGCGAGRVVAQMLKGNAS